MATSSDLVIYAHLTPTTHPDLICETLKFTLKRGVDSQLPMDKETKIDSEQMGESINDLVTKVREFLT